MSRARGLTLTLRLALTWIFGRMEADRLKNSSRELSQSSVLMFISMVREAFVTSVRCRPPWRPPVRFQTSQQSTVPNISLSSSIARDTSGTFSSSQESLVAEK